MSQHPGKTDAQAWDGLAIRPLHPADLDLICAHREALFRESGRPADVLEQMAGPFRAWLEPRLASGDYFGSEMARALHGNGNCP
ncbi:hypothetical protein R1H25_04525 [Stenotrophomonas sp. C2852]|uniref:hypothetical protein n=1 Tax=Stenotrophomonas sp. C2852 TaxID=3077845 RepID=UPI00293D03DF|nr:hypothetical protein [Stenotrophomonas sp. C2852]MDV3434714.1 hypothetical protein [Stenotrophomonas sp. C2852]